MNNHQSQASFKSKKTIVCLPDRPREDPQEKMKIEMSTTIGTTKTSEHITAALRPYPSKLFVETTTRCNLNCFMCVKQSDDTCIDEGDLSEETFTRLLPALPHAKALILNGAVSNPTGFCLTKAVHFLYLNPGWTVSACQSTQLVLTCSKGCAPAASCLTLIVH
jgi:hypothetical protein